MAYATATDVELYLGAPFEGDQDVVAATLVDAASAYVDRVTGRTWVAATVTGEVDQAFGGLVRLEQAPVASVTSVAVRAAYLGATSTVLTAPTGYEILDASEGILAINAYDGDLVVVTYTTLPVVPDDIKQATIMLAAGWLGPTINPAVLTLTSFKSGSKTFEFRDVPVPTQVNAILDAYRSSSLVFA